MMHDFEDGRGPVAAHQHPNGGGWVEDTARVAVTAYVGPLATVTGLAQVTDTARVTSSAEVTGSAVVTDWARVTGSAEVTGSARVTDWAWVTGSAEVTGPQDVASIGPVGSRAATLTLYRTAGGGAEYATGCFRGDYAALHRACRMTHGTGLHYHTYGAAAMALWRLVMGDTPLPPTPTEERE